MVKGEGGGGEGEGEIGEGGVRGVMMAGWEESGRRWGERE